MYSKELLKGTLQTIVLKLLSDNGKMYGYEISQKVKSLSDNTMTITEGALYPTLHKLEAEGYLKTERVFIGNRARKYYKLTEHGGSFVTKKLVEFQDFILLMNKVLQIESSPL
ncbi:MAG: PadR family transcriptional regulator [Cyclobacteriaceae bacterium]|nr:PadR family transcriptional regulator [Cyclobacteriaceae bacterium]